MPELPILIESLTAIDFGCCNISPKQYDWKNYSNAQLQGTWQFVEIPSNIRTYFVEKQKRIAIPARLAGMLSKQILECPENLPYAHLDIGYNSQKFCKVFPDALGQEGTPGSSNDAHST